MGVLKSSGLCVCVCFVFVKKATNPELFMLEVLSKTRLALPLLRHYARTTRQENTFCCREDFNVMFVAKTPIAMYCFLLFKIVCISLINHKKRHLVGKSELTSHGLET